MRTWLLPLLVAACASNSATPSTATMADAGIDVAIANLLTPFDALVTMRTPGWNDSKGTLQRYRRVDRTWRAEGASIPVMIGRSGLAWGRGLHGEGAIAGHDGLEKKEGDGRSPAGAFRLRRSYGYAADPPAGSTFPYAQMTPTLQCIEDTKSAWYNQIVDRASVTPDWSSTDLLRRKDGLYEIIAFVEHNTAPAIAGKGSCILLHVWTSETTTTAGCTSMARDALFSVVAGLIDERSVLVQLPELEYQVLRAEWGLPD